MSEENVEIVRRIYDEFVARLEATRELYDPDFEYDATDVGPDALGVIRGFDAANASLRSYFEAAGVAGVAKSPARPSRYSESPAASRAVAWLR